MTNYVAKGANRAAAEARRSKHAQRTPLPPRDVPVERSAVRVGRELAAENRDRKPS